MVDFRYHIVSIVAVFVALAVGIVLGAGPLKSGADQQLRDEVAGVRSESRGLRDQLSAAQAQEALADRFAAQVGPDLVSDRLPRTPVVVVTMPGADSATATRVATLLRTAGTTVTGTVAVQDSWTATDSADAFAQVTGTRSASPSTAGAGSATAAVPTPAPTPAPSATGAPAVAARLLANALLGNPDRAGGEGVRTPSPQTSALPGFASAELSGAADTTRLTRFSDAGLVRTSDGLLRRAAAAVVIAAPAPENPTTDTRAGVDRLTELTVAVRRAGAGEVVVGPAAAAADGGLLADVRADPVATRLVSTVDSVAHPAGSVATVLALLEQLDGGVGDYGAVGTTDGSLPDITGVSAP